MDQGRVDLVGDHAAAVPVDDLRQCGESSAWEKAQPSGLYGLQSSRVRARRRRRRRSGRDRGSPAVRSGCHGDVHLGPTGQVDDVEEGHVDRGGDDDRVVRSGEVLQRQPDPVHDIGDDVDVGRVNGHAITAQRPAGIRLGQTAGGGFIGYPKVSVATAARMAAMTGSAVG